MKEFDTTLSGLDIFLGVLNILIYLFTLSVMLSYLIIAILSLWYAFKHLKASKSINYLSILQSPEAPSISIVAPAYNESKTIIQNIRSLLSLDYGNYEVIIVNDGSTDTTLENAIEAYELEPVRYISPNNLKTQPIKAIYRSKNPALKNLLVIDKENGGKADALNAGINCANGDYIMNIDVDCILERDCLLKMIQPILDEPEHLAIASGGVVRVANDCIIDKGVIKKVNVPKNLLARFQTLEYLRAFLLGRVAWQYLDGMLLISGALGIFNKKIMIAAGGYSTKTVGEDLEISVRMRKYCRENGIKYKVHFVPEPLVWTEVPEKVGQLLRQRNRWTRGSIETILAHKNLFFNPRYKFLGLIAYPYWIFYEWLAPLLEFFGLLTLFILLILGLLPGLYIALFLLTVVSFAIVFTITTIYAEESTYFQYKDAKGIRKLILAGLIEPVSYHFLVVWASLKGNWDYFIEGKVTWGKQVRKGFDRDTIDRDKKILVSNTSGKLTPIN